MSSLDTLAREDEGSPETGAVVRAPDPRLTAVAAATCAVTAANVYFDQPLLPDIAGAFGVGDQAAGMVATAATVGYAIGILAFVPLGDVRRRRPLILALIAVSALALAAAALAPSLPLLVAASLAIGIFSPVPQLVIPLVVMLSGPAARGRTVGLAQAGLLVGILASRAYAGALADLTGWRGVYWCSFALTISIGATFWRGVPDVPVVARLPYRRLLGSLVGLLSTDQEVRRICVSGAFVGVAFGAFWTTLAFMLRSHYGYGSAVAGLFGLVAAASALCSIYIGRIVDRRPPRTAFALPVLACLAGLGALWAGEVSLVPLLLGTVLFDIGVWGNQVVNQALLFRAATEVHSRLNTLYFGFRFLGIGLGSLGGALCWHRGGWQLVIGLGAAAVAAAAVIGARLDRTSEA